MALREPAYHLRKRNEDYRELGAEHPKLAMHICLS
jgi:hypothetical protein